MRVEVKKIIASADKEFNGRQLIEWILEVQDEHDETHMVGINSIPKNKYEVGSIFDMEIQLKSDGDPKVFKHGEEWVKVVKRSRGDQGSSSQRSGSTTSGPVTAPPRAPGRQLSILGLAELAKAAQFVTLKMGLNADENTKAEIASRIFNTLFIGYDKLDINEPEPSKPVKAPNDPRPDEDTEASDSGIPF